MGGGCQEGRAWQKKKGWLGTRYKKGCAGSAIDELPVPGWTCPQSKYNTKDGCDCGCGVWDPDCEEKRVFGYTPAHATARTGEHDGRRGGKKCVVSYF